MTRDYDEGQITCSPAPPAFMLSVPCSHTVTAFAGTKAGNVPAGAEEDVEVPPPLPGMAEHFAEVMRAIEAASVSCREKKEARTKLHAFLTTRAAAPCSAPQERSFSTN